MFCKRNAILAMINAPATIISLFQHSTPSEFFYVLKKQALRIQLISALCTRALARASCRPNTSTARIIWEERVVINTDAWRWKVNMINQLIFSTQCNSHMAGLAIPWHHLIAQAARSSSLIARLVFPVLTLTCLQLHYYPALISFDALCHFFIKVVGVRLHCAVNSKP